MARQGFVGHSTTLAYDDRGELVLLLVAPKIQVKHVSNYDDLLDEMMEDMTEQESLWFHWYDVHLSYEVITE